jgi:hypothetical protein
MYTVIEHLFPKTPDGTIFNIPSLYRDDGRLREWLEGTITAVAGPASTRAEQYEQEIAQKGRPLKRYKFLNLTRKMASTKVLMCDMQDNVGLQINPQIVVVPCLFGSQSDPQMAKVLGVCTTPSGVKRVNTGALVHFDMRPSHNGDYYASPRVKLAYPKDIKMVAAMNRVSPEKIGYMPHTGGLDMRMSGMTEVHDVLDRPFLLTDFKAPYIIAVVAGASTAMLQQMVRESVLLGKSLLVVKRERGESAHRQHAGVNPAIATVEFKNNLFHLTAIKASGIISTNINIVYPEFFSVEVENEVVKQPIQYIYIDFSEKMCPNLAKDEAHPGKVYEATAAAVIRGVRTDAKAVFGDKSMVLVYRTNYSVLQLKEKFKIYPSCLISRGMVVCVEGELESLGGIVNIESTELAMKMSIAMSRVVMLFPFTGKAFPYFEVGEVTYQYVLNTHYFAAKKAPRVIDVIPDIYTKAEAEGPTVEEDYDPFA